MSKIYAFFFMVFLLIISLGAFAQNELFDYVKKDDGAFKYSAASVEKLADSKIKVLTFDMTSQVWQGIEWKHKVQILLPDNPVRKDTAILLNTGGNPSNNNKVANLLAGIANVPVVIVWNIPNQPLWGRTEDALIAHTLNEAYKSQDYSSWPLLFAMVKSVVKTMDMVEEYTSENNDFEIDKFIVTGASKRGWTSWLTGSLKDPRVIGIMPMVFDFLDLNTQLDHQKSYYEEFSDQIGDYTELDLHSLFKTKEGARLASLIDPYTYKDRLDIPILDLIGTNDPYWTIDSSGIYFQKLPSNKKYLFYAVNGGHDLGLAKGGSLKLTNISGSIMSLASVMKNFVWQCIGLNKMENIDWNWSERNGVAVCTIKIDPNKVASVVTYVEDAAKKDFRQVDWKGQDLAEKTGNGYVFRFSAPKTGARAALCEVKIKSDLGGTYSLFTSPYVLGAKKKVKNIKGEASMGKLNGVRVIEIPKFRAVSSGLATFDEIFMDDNGFGKWIETNSKIVKNLIYASPDFMWHEDDKSIWIWAIEDWVTEKDTAPYDIIDFEGGMYVVATGDENDREDLSGVVGSMVEWINNSDVFKMDDRPGHRGMGHMVGCGRIQDALGIAQQEVFLPVKFRVK